MLTRFQVVTTSNTKTLQTLCRNLYWENYNSIMNIFSENNCLVFLFPQKVSKQTHFNGQLFIFVFQDRVGFSGTG